ncbi:AAA family ATPase [Pseudomonas putida]|uniref:AAA family ATPase n=1 Tax=Pseudomonas putida TaxID=303 RepID=UPI0022652F98|nr:ATP-binding protein [Pseudomonas putida]
MIYSFGARNFFSFKDDFTISFEFNSKVPKTVTLGKKTSTVLGIKGANASGKSNILKALRFISSFASDSFSEEEDAGIRIRSFFNSANPSDFYIDFLSEGIRYIYELSTTEDAVIREAIYKKVARKTLILERKNNTLKYRVSELASLDLITLKSNASIIDTAKHYQIKDLGDDLRNIGNFLAKVRGNVGSLGMFDDKTAYDHNKVSEYYFKNPSALEFTKNIIKNADLGIHDIVIHESVDETGKKKYFPVFHHDSDLDDIDSKWLTYWHESDGTTALYRRLFLYNAILKKGGTLVLDELDTNWHPALLPRILDLFINPSTNPLDAQLIFTSHNLEIMDYLGKYRTYLVSKENGESYCYRLDEIPGDIIRNDRAISGLYREGKLGGVPRL